MAPSAQASSAQASSVQPSQKTLASPVSAVGVGLHIGQMTTVRLVPAAPDQGRYFVRTDLPEAVKIPATVDRVIKTQLSTELGMSADSPQTVRTVEHLLAALTALGLDNVRIEIDGPELPLLDGSAQKWIEAIVDGSGGYQA
ncbi:MAG: UDP-3-O-acyl-N-acetylglucosamine deacetylase, partial [Cyanobacteria bacterium J06554_3]